MSLNEKIMDKSRHLKKELLLEALEKSLGVVTMACRQTKTPRSTYYKWLKEDEEFRKQVEDIENIAIDFVESKLHQQIEIGNTSATIFYLKTKGRKRGYEEQSRMNIASDGRINIEMIPFDDDETD